jgi:hypothetical protein
MSEWPKQVRLCTCGAIRGDFKGGHVCTYPERMKVVPADLARELYEAAKLAVGNAREDDMDTWGKIDALLARYEREVKHD